MDVRFDNCSYLSNRHFHDFCLRDILLHFKKPQGFRKKKKKPKGSDRNDELKHKNARIENLGTVLEKKKKSPI